MIYLLLILSLLSVSCEVSDFQEQDEILDFGFYLNEGWKAFETINLDSTLIDSSDYYYNLSLQMFEVSILAINSEFATQNFLGPYYKSYIGIGWTQLYYAGTFLDPAEYYLRDSLREKSKFYFDSALVDLENSLSDEVLIQDWCNTYSGLSYINYYLGLNDTSYFNNSLSFSDSLIIKKSNYEFYHDQLNYKNIHYLRGKIFLRKGKYNNACTEIKMATDDTCSCIIDNIDMGILLDCFDQFAND